MGGVPRCRHCTQNKVVRPRGLCWKCYYTPGVKDQYPSSSKYALRGIGNHGQSLEPNEPTSARPGSEEKIAVMIARIEAGFSPFHPGDLAFTSGASR